VCLFFFCRSLFVLDFGSLVVVAYFGWVEVGVCRLLVFVAAFVLVCSGLGELGLCFPVSCTTEVGVVADLGYFAVVEFHKPERVWFV